MKALVVEEPGAGLRRLRAEGDPDARPGPGEVLVEVRAAAVNFPDLLHDPRRIPAQAAAAVHPGPGDGRRGRQASARASTRWKVGDAVVGGARIGGFSDMALTSRAGPAAQAGAASASPRPPAYGAAYLTAYVSLVRRAEVEPGEWVLVHGAAGGVGLACVDLAKVLGCRVIAASASDAKLAVVAAEYAPGRRRSTSPAAFASRSRRSPAGAART